MLLNNIRIDIPREILPENLRVSSSSSLSSWENRFRSLIYLYQNGSPKQQNQAKEKLASMIITLADKRAWYLIFKNLSGLSKKGETFITKDHLVQVALIRFFEHLDHFKLQSTKSNSKNYINRILHGAMFDELREVLTKGHICTRNVIIAKKTLERKIVDKEQQLARPLNGTEIDDLINESLSHENSNPEVLRDQAFTLQRLHSFSNHSSLDTPFSETDSGKAVCIGNFLVGQNGLEINDQPIWRSAFPPKDHAIYHLSQILNMSEMIILDLYYGLTTNEPITMKEIGKRFGYSESRTSQILSALIERMATIPAIRDALIDGNIPNHCSTERLDPLYQLLRSQSSTYAGFVFDTKDFAIVKRVFKLFPPKIQKKIDELRGVDKDLPIAPTNEELSKLWGQSPDKITKTKTKIAEYILDFVIYEKELSNRAKVSILKPDKLARVVLTLSRPLNTTDTKQNGHAEDDNDFPPIYRPIIDSKPKEAVVEDGFVSKIPEVIFQKAKKASEKGWLTLELLKSLFKKYAPEIEAEAINLHRYALEKNLILVDYNPILKILDIDLFEYFAIRSKVANLIKENEFSLPKLEEVVKEATDTEDHSYYAVKKFAILHGWIESPKEKLEKLRSSPKAKPHQRDQSRKKEIIASIVKEAQDLATRGELSYRILNEIIAQYRGKPFNSQHSLFRFAKRHNLQIIRIKKPKAEPKPLEPLEKLKFNPAQIQEIATETSTLMNNGFLTPSRLNRIIYERTGKGFGNERSIRHFGSNNGVVSFTIVDEPHTPFEDLDKGLDRRTVKLDIFTSCWINSKASGAKAKLIDPEPLIKKLATEDYHIGNTFTDSDKAKLIEKLLSIAPGSELGILIRNRINYLKFIENLKPKY